MKNKIKILTLFLLLGVIFLLPVLVSAQVVNLSGQVVEQIGVGAESAGLGQPVSPQFIIVRVIKTVLSITGSVFLALVFYGGFVYVNARGDEEQAKKAQKIITGSIIGLAIVLFSYSITIFVGTQTTGQKVNIQQQ